MLHWKEGRKTQTRQVGKHKVKRGRGKDAQWEAWGVLMKHGVWWLRMCLCVCVRVIIWCWGTIGWEWGLWFGWDSTRPITAHLQVMPPTHNSSTTTHAIIDIQTHTEHASRAAPPQRPPLLRNEVVIEVDTVYAAHAGRPSREPQEEWRAGGEEKTFHFLPWMKKNKKSDSYSNYRAEEGQLQKEAECWGGTVFLPWEPRTPVQNNAVVCDQWWKLAEWLRALL